MSEVGKATKDLLKSLKKNIIEEKINEAIVHELNEKEFRLALIDILTKRGSLQLKTAEDLLDEQGMSQMKLAFTHPTMLEPHTYELFETLGDATVNKCIVWYLTRRFPQIKRGESGNEIITEIKKTFINKASFSKRLTQIDMDKFIRYRELSYMEKGQEKRVVMDNSMREDVFEAMMGAIEDLIDSKIMVNTGYCVIYNMITSVLDEDKNISINIGDVLDSKTKINEVFSKRKSYGDEVVISGIYSSERGGWIGTASVTLSANPAIPGPSSPLKKEFTSHPQRSKQIGEFDVAQQVLDFMEKEYGVLWSRKSTKLIL
jgi:dsRNA-specific ribonuclease